MTGDSRPLLHGACAQQTLTPLPSFVAPHSHIPQAKDPGSTLGICPRHVTSALLTFPLPDVSLKPWLFHSRERMGHGTRACRLLTFPILLLPSLWAMCMLPRLAAGRKHGCCLLCPLHVVLGVSWM